MSKKKKQEVTAVPATEQPVATLTKQQIAAAATNSPEMAQDEFRLGDRTFKLVDLGYDEYTEFTTMLEPLLKAVAGMMTSRVGIKIPGISANIEGVSPSHLIDFCKGSLPRMAQLVCNMQAVVNERPDQEVSVEWVKKNGKTPFNLAKIVMAQMQKNQMIEDFASFFVRMLPTLMQMQKLQGPSAK
jgi:hypothetical protein